MPAVYCGIALCLCLLMFLKPVFLKVFFNLFSDDVAEHCNKTRRYDERKSENNALKVG